MVLLKDYAGADFVSYTKKDVTFDLDGHAYSRTNGGAAIQVSTNATFTVKDTAENGSFSETNGIGIETKAATATVNVLSGDITGTTYGISADNAAVNVRGGKVKGRVVVE